MLQSFLQNSNSEQSTPQAPRVTGPPREDTRFQAATRGPPSDPRNPQQVRPPVPPYPSTNAPNAPLSLTNLYSPQSRSLPIPSKFFMKAGDIKFVVSRVLHPLETQDPYFDDYYYLQFMLQQARIESHRAAAMMQSPRAPLPSVYAHIPAPQWRDSKERMLKKMHDTKTKIISEAAAKGSELPEGIETTKDDVGSLGMIVKSDVFKPREVLSMTALHKSLDEEEEEGAEEFHSKTSVPCSNPLIVTVIILR